VIWATGYRSDYSWIDLTVLDADGRPRQRRGVTEIPGLYFLGLSWQHTRGSALLGWVGDDAKFIAGEMEAAARVETTAEATNYEDESAPTLRAAGATEGV
jgi:putative flavoprotein involved in K+ transport